jgi:hypothetical protein
LGIPLKEGFGGEKRLKDRVTTSGITSNVKEGKMNVLPFWVVGRVPKRCFYLRPTLDEGPGSNFLGTKSD